MLTLTKKISARFSHFCRKAFYEADTKLFVAVNDFLSITIIISILSIIFESVPEFSSYYQIFLTIEYATVLVFSVEYICRIIGSPKKTSYIFSFFGLVDLISTLPTLLHLSNLVPLKSLRALRILRFLRMIRLAKVVRFEHLEKHSKEDRFSIIRINLRIYFLTLVFSVLILGTFIYVFEHSHPLFRSIPLSMLWVLEALLGGSISTTIPQTYAGIIIFMIARFISYILLGFIIHIMGSIISHILLGKKTTRSVDGEI